MMTDIPRKRARTNCVYECRACLVNIDDDSGCVDIFCAWDPPWSGMGVSIAQDLNKLSNVQISDSDTHSKKICIKCCSRLQEALDFKLSVQKNDLLLRRRHSESGDENPLWPKPIQVDKNIAANTLNAMAVEVKEELLSENEYEMNEPCSELSEPNLDIKIEPEEMTPVAIPSVESEVDGLCSNSRPAIKEVKTNGATEFLDEISRMSGSKPRKKGSTWDEDSLRRAMEAVQNNQLNTNAAALKFNIPRRTLRNHLLSGNSTKIIGKTTVLTKILEEDLSQRIKRFAKLGIPLTPKFIRKQAFLFCERFKIKHSFNMSTRMAGRKWLKMFLVRNPSISKRKPQLMNPARAQKRNKPIVKHHFEEVKKLYEELNIIAHPERLYNMDEMGCRITVHKQNVVLAEKGNTRVHLVAPEHAENVTIAMCVNAVGNAIPPMIIFKGIRYRSELGSNLPHGTKRLPEEVKEELMSEEEAEPVADMSMDCMLCFERFNTVKGLKAHVIAVHSYNSFPLPRAEAPNACTQCDRGFTTLAQLSTHEACHSSFKCYVCGNKFPTSFLLDNHRNKCERTSALSRLETLEDVKRPISVYYIIDKMSSQNKDSRSGSPENLEKLSFLEPLDPKKYKIIQEEEDLPLEPSASRHSTVKVYPSAKKLASKFKSSEVISKTINEPNKVSSYEETFIINIIKYDRTSEGNTGKLQESINMDTSAMKDQSDPESKLAEGLKQVKESVEVSHSNDLALKSKSNNEESSYKIQDKSSEVSNTIKENAASEDSYNTKENESVVVDKICGVSDKMNNIKSVERNIFELCNRIREKVINNQSTLNEDSQKCNEMDEYKESSIPEICNKTKELVVDTLETTQNEESNKMDMTSKESTIPEVCNKTKERVVNTIASKLNENVQKSNEMDIISEKSTPIEVCNKTKEHVINTFETILNEKSNNLDQNSSEESTIPEVSNITNEHDITTLNENSQESIKTDDIKFEESRIPEVSNKTKEQVITTIHEKSNQMDGIKSENSTIPEVLSKTIDRDGISTIETTLNKDSQENRREESGPEDFSNTIDRDDITTHEMMPNEDSQESKENKREQLQSIETCANITTDSKQMNTTENRPNQLKDLKPLLSGEENIKNPCSPGGQSMEVKSDTQSIAEDDAMDIDNDLESEIKASLENNKPQNDI